MRKMKFDGKKVAKRQGADRKKNGIGANRVEPETILKAKPNLTLEEQKLISIAKELKKAEYRSEAEELRTAASILNIDIETSGYHGIEKIEGFIDQVLRGHSQSPVFAEIVDALVDVAIKLSDYTAFGTWSHSICHLFEEYRDAEEPSFLRFQSLFSSAEKLIDYAVKRAVELGDVACVPRIIGPLREFNLDNLDPDHLDGEFPFRPASVTNEDILELLKQEKYFDYDDIVKFCSVATPRELLLEIDKDSDPTVLTTNRVAAKNATETVDGIFVDVDGTLIVDGKLDARVYERIQEESEGKGITIFTGGDPEEKTRQLKALGVDDKFLPVRPKSDFYGKILEFVWDDTEPAWQGFRAIRYRNPHERR